MQPAPAPTGLLSGKRGRRFLDQVGAIILSLALALVIWLIAVSQANPLVTQDFPERIPITVRGLDAALQPVQELGSQSVRANVRAPRAAWDDLDVGDFTAAVDLTGYGTGSHDVPVRVVVNDSRVTVLSVSPPNLRIQLDPLASRVMTTVVQILDAPAFGYDALPPVVEPLTMTVSGPETQLALVDQLIAPVFLLNAKSQVERTVEVRPINRQNQAVSGVELSSQFVNVVVPVEQWPGRKEVAVRINLVGQPAPGYRLSTVRSDPSTVVLQGDANILASVPGFIETEALSIEGATGDIRRRLGLVVPAGASVLGDSNVEALVSITPIEGGTTVRAQPIVQGLDSTYEASVSPDAIDVILSGPVPLLESLNPDDMFVILDLAGLLPGTHVVTPRVVLPEGIRQEGVLPETVEVIITSTLPPTPQGPAAVTPEVVATASSASQAPPATAQGRTTPVASPNGTIDVAPERTPEPPPAGTTPSPADPTLTPSGSAP